ncbi:hypothetical protein P0Y31_09640 [Knoellia sp. 3-2P3]|uniref:hypothetical protein n=1 Tax=unclassified Knoellia TaxID=2618719 RepID=UPI0023DC4992|nr:hypothetical protein [Knoellia sp. 3-2P3]MDF2092606.1 hypothetical protein [Knoellia sp. 3-2P3]
MSEITINRRQAVRAAAGVAAGGLLVTGAGVSAASANSSSNGLVGSWLVHYEDENGDKGISVASIIDGGVFITNDIRPAGGVGTGSWEDKGDDKFKATSWIGYAAEDTSAKLEVWGKLKDDKVSGRFEVTVYDSDGNETDTVKGTFEAEPLDA